MPSTPERFTWATYLLELKGNLAALEIGCGVGILADCVAMKLTTGKITAIDRSAAMISKAVKRNQLHISNKKAEFIQGDFLKLKLPLSHFDRVVAFNVNFFWKDCSEELAVIHQTLKKNGKLYIFHQAPYEITIASAKPLKELLVANGFEVHDVKSKKLQPTSALCVVAKPV